MRIAVIGKGKLGSTLGAKWATAGHEVIFGLRPGSQAVPGLIPASARSSGMTNAVKDTDIALMAVPGRAVNEVLQLLGQELAGKLVIDSTNCLHRVPMHSLESYAKLAPKAVVVRAFNSLGWEVFNQPMFGDERPDLFYSGPNSATMNSVIEQLIEDLGLRPRRLGDLNTSEILDHWTRLYFAAARNQGRHIAFRLLSDTD